MATPTTTIYEVQVFVQDVPEPLIIRLVAVDVTEALALVGHTEVPSHTVLRGRNAATLSSLVYSVAAINPVAATGAEWAEDVVPD